MMAARLLRQTRSSFSTLSLPFDIAEEVRTALAASRPVVALETAIVTHGLSEPHAHEVPLECERVIRQHGAVPATIGVLRGRIKIGLSREEIETLARPAKGKQKIGRRELAAAVVNVWRSMACGPQLIFNRAPMGERRCRERWSWQTWQA
jgi:pseudouridine-5'-phosphate glycosidase/pseudouridine kinase